MTHCEKQDCAFEMQAHLCSFFDVTSAGRVLNRFSSDMATADDSLPFIMNILLANLFGLAGKLLQPWLAGLGLTFFTATVASGKLLSHTALCFVGILVILCLSQPLLLPALLPLALIFRYLQQYYRQTAREVRRLSNTARYASDGPPLTGPVAERQLKRCDKL